jgi:hypothetical protein
MSDVILYQMLRAKAGEASGWLPCHLERNPSFGRCSTSLPSRKTFRLIGGEANQVKERVEQDSSEDTKIPDTQREAIILARVGQGKFRANVQDVERACRVTKVERLEHLVASHTKPWRDSTNEERLDGENGLLLTPTIDHLFDKVFISFEDKGDLIVSPVADRPSLLKMGIKPEAKVNVGVFSEGQRVFLEYHRENVLRMSRRR